MFIKFLKNSILCKKALLSMVVLFVFIALFCFNVILGYAETSYYNSLDGTWYSTVAFTNMDDKTKSTDLLQYVKDTMGYDVGSVLYFKNLGDELTIIGWSGTDSQTLWGAHTGGRMFTKAEMENAKNVIYMHLMDYMSLNEDKNIVVNGFEYDSEVNSVTIDGFEYDIVGTGILVSNSFLAAIGNDCEQTSINDDVTYAMIPYKTFIKNGYEPDLVLLHFSNMNHSQYISAYENLKAAFPNIKITVSDNNSDLDRIDLKIRYMPLGMIMVLIIGMSLINIISIWISEQRQIVYVYQICGLSKSKLKLFLLAELFLIVVFSEIMALTVQFLLRSPLALIFVERMPNMPDILVTTVSAFALIAVIFYKRINKNLKFEGGVGR